MSCDVEFNRSDQRFEAQLGFSLRLSEFLVAPRQRAQAVLGFSLRLSELLVALRQRDMSFRQRRQYCVCVLLRGGDIH